MFLCRFLGKVLYNGKNNNLKLTVFLNFFYSTCTMSKHNRHYSLHQAISLRPQPPQLTPIDSNWMTLLKLNLIGYYRLSGIDLDWSIFINLNLIGHYVWRLHLIILDADSFTWPWISSDNIDFNLHYYFTRLVLIIPEHHFLPLHF